MLLRPEYIARIRRSFLAVALLGMSSVLLAGCGFTPLYGTTGSGSSVAEQMAHVYVPDKDLRLEQLIRNQLISSMSPPGSAQGARYTLDFQSNAGAYSLVLERNTDISRRLYRLDVKYTLTDNESGEVIHEGRTFSHVGYDRIASEFANIQAQINAEERAAIEVSEDIKTRVAAYFSST